MYPYHSTYACILLFFFSLFPLYVFFSPYAVKLLLFSHHLLLITIPPLQIYPNRKNISPGIDLLANPIQTRCAKFLNGKRQMNQQILLNKYLYNSFIQQISSSNCVSDSFLNIIFLQLHCQSSSSSLNISDQYCSVYCSLLCLQPTRYNGLTYLSQPKESKPLKTASQTEFLQKWSLRELFLGKSIPYPKKNRKCLINKMFLLQESFSEV